MTNLANYSTLVRRQNANTKYKKIHYTAPVFNDLLIEDQIINKVNTLNCECTGVIKSNNIYTTNYKDYFEFIYSPLDSQVFEEWEYYYISVDRLEEVKFKVPFVQVIDFETKTSKVEYLSSNTITPLVLKDAPSINVDTFLNNTHPLLQNFSFTGVIFVTNNNLVYEYYNTNELLDSAEVNYLSTYQPSNFRSELNIDTVQSIYPSQNNIVPNKVVLKNELRTFNFTGQVNNTLIKNKLLYKYEEVLDDFNVIVFIPYKPFYGSLDILEQSIGKLKTIQISSLNNKQRIKIKQKSYINITINN